MLLLGGSVSGLGAARKRSILWLSDYQHDAWKGKAVSIVFIYCNLLWRYVDAVLDSAWFLDPVLGPPKITLVDCLST